MGNCQSGDSVVTHKQFKVLLISSSLRKHSTNTGLLRAAAEIGNKDLTFTWGSIAQIPLFNEDLQQKGVPSSVEKLKQQIKESDAVLFGVSENNFSVTAALKNAYDWLSRGESPVLKDFPAAMISSGADQGGLRAQKAFRIVGEYLKVQFLSEPVVAVKRFNGKYFNEQGDLIDDQVKQEIKPFLQAFAKWISECKLKKK